MLRNNLFLTFDKYLSLFFAILMVVTLLACGGGGEIVAAEEQQIDPVTTNVPPSIENQTYSVIAGQNLEINLGPLLDRDGDIISYIISSAENVNSSSASNLFIYNNSIAETEILTVTATDGINSSVQASITIVVTALETEVFFISPEGDDNNDGLSVNTAWLSFKHAFDVDNGGMSSGSELILLGGNYSIENGTGIMRGVDANGNILDFSAAIPSGISREFPTIIRAAIPGQVVIIGEYNIKPLFIGRSTRKDRFITVSGIRFEGGGKLFNTQFITLKNLGFHGSLVVGTNDHNEGNSDNLIEDVWIWAANRRVIATNYRSDRNVWRRVIIRSDGCDDLGCEDAPKPDPSVGITVYDSQDVSLQNVIVIDRLLRNDGPYADFATAQHTQSGFYLGQNEWLGNMSVNSQDASLVFEADYVMSTGDPIWYVKDFVSVGSSRGGINIGNKPLNYTSAGSPSSLIENATVLLSSANNNVSAIRVTPDQNNVIVKNTISTGGTRAGFNVINSTVEDSAGYNPLSTEGDFDTDDCRGTCISLAGDPQSDGSFLFPQRIESNSNVDVAIANVNLGANVEFAYGVNGSIFGDEDYNKLSSNKLWPWPNESRIKQEMCVNINEIRGFCSVGNRLDGENLVTLTSYIWEYLGHPVPIELYQ